MPQSSSFGFFTGTVDGHQKIKRYARRQIMKLPAHKRLDPKEKMLRKFAYQRKAAEDDK